MKKKYYWSDFEKDIKQLAKKIEYSGEKFDEIHGIPRGGLIAAVVLSHLLNIPLCLKFNSRKKVLIVDDISDTGNTLLTYNRKNARVATLFYVKSSKVKPDFWIRLKNEKDWIIYPWETF